MICNLFVKNIYIIFYDLFGFLLNENKKLEERIFYVDVCKGRNFYGIYMVILWKERNDGGIKILLIMFMCDFKFFFLNFFWF